MAFERAIQKILQKSDEAEAERRGVSVDQIRREREQNQARLDAELREEAAKAAERREEETAERAAEERELGERLGIGVRVRPGIAMRLSGLLAHSAGDGATRATVTHLLVKEDFTRGRLSREAGQVLCRPSLRGFELSERDVDSPITCARCRAMATRER